MLACQVGLKSAAERLGIPYDAVRQRSSREGWLEAIPRDQPLPPTVAQPVTLVTSPAMALAASMREDAVTGRAAALRAGRKALVRIADLDPDELIQPEVANVAHTWGKTHATAAGYAASDSIAKVSLSITAERGAAPPATVEAEWVDVPE